MTNLIDSIKIYNELTKNWLDGIKWLSNPKLTDAQRLKGEERLYQRLEQLNEVYKELLEAGIKVIPEQFIDEEKYR